MCVQCLHIIAYTSLVDANLDPERLISWKNRILQLNMIDDCEFVIIMSLWLLITYCYCMYVFLEIQYILKWLEIWLGVLLMNQTDMPFTGFHILQHCTNISKLIRKFWTCAPSRSTSAITKPDVLHIPNSKWTGTKKAISPTPCSTTINFEFMNCARNKILKYVAD